ncbi:uncharacterized protein LOC135395302 isoform X3 [Ornithodoros turicata]|uniref:uncharacterized protein LOC135395302 isoform X3 n=1 Tax=Ornithodoros turicata TaxID=34597 RepID=UPI00313905C5
MAQCLGPVALDKMQWKYLALLVHANFWMATCVSLHLPLFSTEEIKQQACPAYLSFISASFEVAIVAAVPLISSLVGRAALKNLLGAGMLLSGVSALAFGFVHRIRAGAPFVVVAFVLRVLEGFGASVVLLSQSSVVSAHFPRETPGVIALLEVLYCFGIIVAPSLGSAVHQVIGTPGPFLLQGFFIVTGGFYSLTFHRNDDGEKLNCEEVLQVTELFHIGLCLDLCLVIGGLGAVVFHVFTLMPHLKRYQVSRTAAIILLVGIGLVYVTSALLWSRLLAYLCAPKAMALVGCVCAAVSFAFIGLSKANNWKMTTCTLASLLLFGASVSCQNICAFSSAIREALSRGFPACGTTYTRLSVVFAIGCAVGALLGCVLGTLTLEVIGYQAGTFMFVILEACQALSLACHLSWTRLKQHRLRDNERTRILQSSIVTKDRQ